MNGDGNGFHWEHQHAMKAAQYTRDIEATRGLPYEEKFASFLRLCDQGGEGEFQIIVVAFPVILGDNYDELIRNLAASARAGLLVAVADAGD